jgi:hypothetical protein
MQPSPPHVVQPGRHIEKCNMNLESCTYLRTDTNTHHSSLPSFDVYSHSGGGPADQKVQRTVNVMEDKITGFSLHDSASAWYKGWTSLHLIVRTATSLNSRLILLVFCTGVKLGLLHYRTSEGISEQAAEKNCKMDDNDRGCQGVKCILVSQDTVQQRAP